MNSEIDIHFSSDSMHANGSEETKNGKKMRYVWLESNTISDENELDKIMN